MTTIELLIGALNIYLAIIDCGHRNLDIAQAALGGWFIGWACRNWFLTRNQKQKDNE